MDSNTPQTPLQPLQNPETQDSELTVGISEFINTHPSILGCYKYRYSDFVVIEISESGTPVYHNPDEPQTWKTRIDNKEFKKGQQILSLSPTQKTNLSSILEESQFEEIIELYNQVNNKEKNPTLELDFGWSDSKEERKNIHQLIRENLSNFESTTSDHCGKKIIKAFYTKKIKRMNFGDEKYLSFTLMKKNHDTGNVTSRVAKLLNKRPQDLEVAGNKDKRGVTTQRVVMSRIEPQELMRIMYIPNWPFEEIQFSNASYCKKGLRIGDLYGNLFRLALRFVESDEENLCRILEKVKVDGFINYFGLQRFGKSQNCKTHEIGRYLVEKNYYEAFKAILWQDNDFEDVKIAKKKYFDGEEGGSIDGILRVLPKNYNLERSLLEGMRKQGKSGEKNYLAAIGNIPRNMRNLYPHAYQSYLWNTCASLRLKNFGNK